MADQIIMKKGDTLPIRELELQEKDSDGNITPIDLTGSTVEFYVYDEDTDTMIIDGGSVTINDAVNGLIEYEWAEDDVKNVGTYKGEFKVIYADGELTVPNDDFVPVSINEDAEGGIS